MSIGSNLRQLRLDSGMTQEQAAEKLGVTRQALSSYELGRTRPDIDMLMRLCSVYGTDLDGILYGEHRGLRAAKRVKAAAVAVLSALIGLTLASSSLLCIANRVFPVPADGQSQADLALLASHSRLTRAWAGVDGIILLLSLLGFAVLLILLLPGRCSIPMGQKAIFMAVLSAGLLLAALPFAAADPVFPATNYFVTPVCVIGRMLLFFVIHLVTILVGRRRPRAPCKP